MNVIFEIADWRDYDPLNGLHSPNGFRLASACIRHFNFKRDMVIKPFLQSYEYLVIGYDQIYGIVKIIPHCHFSKKVFQDQYGAYLKK